jgi:proteasome lid subunit RPN8/RPN11
VLRILRQQWLEMVGLALDCVPEEACGLLAGPPGASVASFWPCENVDHSARTYAIDGRELERVERALDEAGEGHQILGIMHSHTHTDAYPSPTDVERAELLGPWHFLIVSLRYPDAQARSYRIIDGVITEEPIELGPG